MGKVRVVLGTALVLALVGCIPQTTLAVKTHVERTTVVVRDPEGKVIRIEEREHVLQEYNAAEAVQLKNGAAPKPATGR